MTLGRTRPRSRATLWLVLVSMAGTFASQLFGDPHDRFGGPALRVVVLCVSGALLVFAAVLLMLQRARRGRRSAP